MDIPVHHSVFDSTSSFTINQTFWFDPILSKIFHSSKSSLFISSSSSLSLLTLILSFISSIQLYLITIVSCCVISFSSMFSLFIFYIFINKRYNYNKLNNSKIKTKPVEYELQFDPNKNEFLKLTLAFAVGSLVADVFLHILPEASVVLVQQGYSIYQLQHFLGVWILVGLITFAAIETFISIMATDRHEKTNPSSSITLVDHNLNITKSSLAPKSESNLRHRNISIENTTKVQQKNNNNCTDKLPPSISVTVDSIGYLHLLANSFDNFIHGMSVAASFLVSYKMGILTTAAIAIHEVPHEIVDFVILLRSGFTCFDAFRAQLSISLVTIIGSVTVLYFDQFQQSTFSYTLWILPLTCGGFIYIALTSLLPELLIINEVDDKSINQALNSLSSNSNNTESSTFCYPKKGKKLQIIFWRIVFVILGVILMETINTIDL